MNLREKIYGIDNEEISSSEKEAYIHFLGNLVGSITLLGEEAYEDYKKEIEKLVKKIYDAYLSDKDFRNALTDLANRTNYGNASKYLCQLPSKYYDNYFKKLEEIRQRLIENF